MAKDAPEGEVTTTITATTHLTLPAHPTPLTYAELNPRSSPSEFFGPIGTLAVTIFTPAITWALWFTCNETTGCPPSTRAGWQAVAENLVDWPSSAGKWWDWKAAGVFMAFYLYLVLCWAVLPGDKVQGNLLRDGTKKTYTMNGEHGSVRVRSVSPHPTAAALLPRNWTARSTSNLSCRNNADLSKRPISLLPVSPSPPPFSSHPSDPDGSLPSSPL